MSIVVSDLSERLDTLTKLVLAEPVARIGHSRVTVRPLTLRGKVFFQLEYQQGQKVAHRNVARGALLETFEQELDGLFRSVTLCTETETRQYVRKTNGAYKCTAKSGAARAAVTASHNRKKEYILQEGENIPALVDLGVFTPDFKIVKAKYDKYKQINRFIELVDDAFRAYGRDEITILDFGCGKSYLTFVLYYYFAVKRGVRAKIIGYDLKEDVVEHCNEVAARYGYSDLTSSWLMLRAMCSTESTLTCLSRSMPATSRPTTPCTTPSPAASSTSSPSPAASTRSIRPSKRAAISTFCSPTGCFRSASRRC